MSFRRSLLNSAASVTELTSVIQDDIADAAIPNAKVAGAAYSIVPTKTNNDVDITLANGIASGATGSVIDKVTLKQGTNVAFAVNGDEITINNTNFSDVVVFASNTLRNQSTATAWHKGDVAIVTVAGTGTTSYFYIGADQSTGAATSDSDWQELHSPAGELTGAEIITDINTASGSGTIDIGKLNANVAVKSAACSTSSLVLVLSQRQYQITTYLVASSGNFSAIRPDVETMFNVNGSGRAEGKVLAWT